MTAENRAGTLITTSMLVLAAATSVAISACSSAPASPSTTTTPNPRADEVPSSSSPSPSPSSPASETKELPLQTAEPAPLPEPPTTTAAPPQRQPDPKLGPVFGCSRTAVMVVIDRSGSMSGRPIEMARESTERVAKAMTEKDCFGVVVFDSIATRLVPIAKMDDKHREETTSGLKKLIAGGGTDIHPALSMALEDIRSVTSTSKKLVIFLTDGQSPQNGLKELATTMGHENIFLTTIALGAGADKELLRDLASAANGRFYSVMSVDQLPKVFEKEAQIITNANVKK
jgi:uncharacterized protein YegL